MFQLIEKQGERKAVHSKSDLEYMQRRGWQPVSVAPVAEVQPAPVVERVKRKYTKRAK